LIFDSERQRKFWFKFVIPSILHALQHLLLSIPLLVEEVILHHKSLEDTHENPWSIYGCFWEVTSSYVSVDLLILIVWTRIFVRNL
jgi:hypothetical protein